MAYRISTKSPWIWRDYEEEIIILRGKDKKQIEYDDSDATIRMRNTLKRINECLGRHSILLYVKDSELAKIRDELGHRIDFTQKHLRRIFNNGSFEQGGRFYGGWWQNIPSEYRHLIRINGKDTVECDYSGLHVNMLYAQEKLEAPSGDVYHIDGYSNDKTCRDFVKRLLLVMINSKDQNATWAAMHEAVNIGGQSGSKLKLPQEIKSTKREDIYPIIEAFKKKHQPIAHYFNTSAGIDLQYKDSLIAEKVMSTFAIEMDYAILPIHDSFIIHHGLKEELIEAMNRAFQDTCGVDTHIDLKFNSIDRRQQKRREREGITSPLDRIERLEHAPMLWNHKTVGFCKISMLSDYFCHT